MKDSTVHKTYTEAIREAIDLCMKKDRAVFIIGEGVPDPKGIFGTTTGLREKYGSKRVLDMPLSENAVTGVCVGAALNGMRPILTHQRVDFSLLALDQVINSAAKWHYTFGAQQTVPLVIKMTIGMGWGQGPQHSQNLQALYAHIPGLKVVMPSTPYDAKGLMIASIEDKNPVIFIDHRWLHGTFGSFPRRYYKIPIGKARIVEKGTDLTIVATSYMTIESRRATVILKKIGISAELIDLRSLKPLDIQTVLNSVRKTKRLLVADLSHREYGVAAEIVAEVAENQTIDLLSPPLRITAPDFPSPATPALTKYYYPRFTDVAKGAVQLVGGDMFGLQKILKEEEQKRTVPLDVPDQNFSGPF